MDNYRKILTNRVYNARCENNVANRRMSYLIRECARYDESVRIIRSWGTLTYFGFKLENIGESKTRIIKWITTDSYEVVALQGLQAEVAKLQNPSVRNELTAHIDAAITRFIDREMARND